jgi:hypothetical protein
MGQNRNEAVVKAKAQIQIEQQVIYTLAQVIEAFPQYTIAQHLCHFMRKKEELKETYFWSDEALLNKLELYYDELKRDLALDIENIDDED